MTWDLETAKKHLSSWLEAELAISTGQSYRMGTRYLFRAELKEVREQIKFWRAEVERLSQGRRGPRVMRAVPRDL
ncbi:DUF6148 family protein [Brevibacillus laterosporus]|uniref:DUF6148 family protein n=1 Tax=Brevibacillus laterosporus TaxID=1465 RepID=UPI0018CC8981|nr:DUF6148 family protein [Brevibacillus laterosporus]MBG9799522.1 hypothetical protein [Brevibacillus laterosporus]MED1909757.1 DUF6148 family protein [Brevibacillus laterosporus]